MGKGLARTQTSTPSVQNLSPSLSLLSSAPPSSKSFSPCGWLDRRCNQSTPAALSRGLWLDFPRSGFLKTEKCHHNAKWWLHGGTMVAPWWHQWHQCKKSCDMEIWTEEPFPGKSIRFRLALKMCYSSTFNRVLNCI